MSTSLKFPIGEYLSNKNPSATEVSNWIKVIGDFPQDLNNVCAGITADQLKWKYRPDGWSVKQVIHHCADSHMNSVIRFKLALTEETPIIRPYQEKVWAELSDSLDNDIEPSLQIIEGLHKKWVLLLQGLSTDDLKRDYIHPEHGRKINLAETIGIYAWHCRHHLAHIKNGIESEGRYN
jgi:hypothetical protein